MSYSPKKERYEEMPYRRCGKSGLRLPVISLGLWHNFGSEDEKKNYQEILHYAFDRGITHFDLANNYGPPPGAAEENFGRILHNDFKSYRDEMIIATKAGYYMWPGPYGDWGSKKYLISSLDQSLRRMKLDYVDIFYHHRPDPETPLEETMDALVQVVQQGKALYVGISNYGAGEAQAAIEILESMGIHCLIHQPKYSMLVRWVEEGLLDLLQHKGTGCIAFSPLAQGLLTDKYLKGIPVKSRAANPTSFLQKSEITSELINRIQQLNAIANSRKQSLAQMAISWILKDERITSVLVGASSARQLKDNLCAIDAPDFSPEELNKIDAVLK